MTIEKSNHHKLIRQLRNERSLTQQQLAAGITHRTTLISFEKNGTQISFETLSEYLNRMNVTIDEYQYLLNNKQASSKDQAKNEYWQLLLNTSQTLTSPQVVTALKNYLQTYHDSGDFFYYYLYSQLYLVLTYRSGSFDSSTPQVKEIKNHLITYLKQIKTWGRFELVLFSNCMFIFDDDFIQSIFKRALRKARQYQAVPYFTNDLKLILFHALKLAIDRHNYQLFEIAFAELVKLQHRANDADIYIQIKIFSFIRSTLKHQATEKEREELFTLLHLMAMDQWADYVRETIVNLPAKS